MNHNDNFVFQETYLLNSKLFSIMLHYVKIGKSWVSMIVGGQCKKPTAQTEHLVFADTKANAEKPKEPFFPTHGQTNRIKKLTL